MKRFFALYYVLAILLVGCAEMGTKPSWSKSGADTEQAKRDLAGCRSATPGKGAGIYARGLRQTPQQGQIDSCMRVKGYKLAK